jgi:hypothetical protein
MMVNSLRRYGRGVGDLERHRRGRMNGTAGVANGAAASAEGVGGGEREEVSRRETLGEHGRNWVSTTVLGQLIELGPTMH